MRVVTEAATLDQDGLTAWLPGAMGRVVALAEQAGGAVTAAELAYLDRPTADPVILVVYEGNPNEAPCLVEVAVPVRGDGDRDIPAHREAFVRVTKSLVSSGRLGVAYDTAERAAGDVTGPPRETYWTDFGAAAPGDEVFDVGWPTR